MGATPTGATPTGPTLDPLNILVNKFNIATHVALILFLFSSWINYLLYDTKSVMVFWQLLSKIKRFVTIFRISWNGPTLFNIPIGDFPPEVVALETRFPTSSIFWKSVQNLTGRSISASLTMPRPLTASDIVHCGRLCLRWVYQHTLWS